MSKIKPWGDLVKHKSTGSTREITYSGRLHVFTRQTDHGLVVVESYLPDQGHAETLIAMCTGGFSYHQWYKHGVTTTRSAALLVNRFIADVLKQEEYKQ